jgi:RimJ/RimL family protein N-acetyltransferase
MESSYYLAANNIMIQLAYFEESDFEQLIEWIHNEELLLQWSGGMFLFPLTKDSMEWYLKDVNDLATSTAFVYKVIDTDTNKVIGHISLGGISRKNKYGRITRVLIGDTENKGKGYCKQMIQAILKIGFEDLNLHRIELGVYDFNKAAIKCYENAGMKIEGISRDCLLTKDGYWSLVNMSILESEWKSII